LGAGDVEVADEHLHGLPFESSKGFLERGGNASVKAAGERRRVELRGESFRNGAVVVYNEKDGSH
jgi:hypothetical protein